MADAALAAAQAQIKSLQGRVAELEAAASAHPAKVIGRIETVWPTKNGTPRQGRAHPGSRGRLTLPNEDCVASLGEFSHVWLLFHFHLNANTRMANKVNPPRLPKGCPKPGMLATRTPHRFSPIGLTLARLLDVQGSTLILAEVDLVSGTPIFDVKPYIHWADSVAPGESRMPLWLQEVISEDPLSVNFTPEAEAELEQMMVQQASALRFLDSVEHAKEVIQITLSGEPRSRYFKSHCMEDTYIFPIDCLDVECKFVGEGGAGDEAIVTKVRLIKEGVGACD